MQSFAARVCAWQQRAGRHGLPWQGADPYRVWLSEIMLQQTQVATVIPYFERFVARFPTLAALAAAEEDAVMAQWAGLGYYSRARHLHRAAQRVMERWGGQLPSHRADLETLPGIGRSTAAAIAVFAFGRREAILDGNVKRLLSRHAGIDGDLNRPATLKSLWARAEALLPGEALPTYTQGLMDLGNLICTRSRPRCEACPVAADCVHRQQPPPPRPARPRPALPSEQRFFLVLTAGDRLYLQRRPDSGIWRRLYCPPDFGSRAEAEAAALALVQDFPMATRPPIRAGAPISHRFTHRLWTLHPLWLDLTPALAGAPNADPGAHWSSHLGIDPSAAPVPGRFYRREEWEMLGLPQPIRRLLLAGPPAVGLF